MKLLYSCIWLDIIHHMKQASSTGQPSLIHIKILSGKTSQNQVILKIKSLLKDNYVVQYVTIVSIK